MQPVQHADLTGLEGFEASLQQDGLPDDLDGFLGEDLDGAVCSSVCGTGSVGFLGCANSNCEYDARFCTDPNNFGDGSSQTGPESCGNDDFSMWP